MVAVYRWAAAVGLVAVVRAVGAVAVVILAVVEHLGTGNEENKFSLPIF
jgi:hypothetical protein